MFANLDNALLDLLPASSPARLPSGSVFELHPLQLTGWIETVWEAWRVFHTNGGQINGAAPTAPHPGLPRVRYGSDIILLAASELPRLPGPPQTLIPPVIPEALLEQSLGAIDPTFRIRGIEVRDGVRLAARQALDDLFTAQPLKRPMRPWLHLMYAYLIENTRVVEICERILREALHDETFGVLSEASHRWLRTTEDLFFRDGSSSLIRSVTSWARSDLRASRANAYYRMFGMETNHGGADGKPYAFTRPASANTEFVRTLVDWLRELWRGYQNATNVSGPTATDPGAIDELTNRLKTMLHARRQSVPGQSNLAREELVFVSMLSWFDLTVSFDSPIVTDLKANGTTPEERLRRLGERVKLPAHSRSRSFFILAQNLPLLLMVVEEGLVDSQDDQLLLYRDEGSLRTAVLNVITHWSMATGQDLKAVPTTGMH
jgi:hypothetical protein